MPEISNTLSDIHYLIELRKEVPNDIFKNLDKQIPKILDCLQQIQIHLENEYTGTEIMEKAQEKCVDIQYNDNKALHLLPQLIQQQKLLTILTKIRKSRIGQIIDNI